MRVLKIVGVVIGVLVLAVLGLFVGARFADGPLGPIPGGPFASGEWVEKPVGDWSFAADEQEIELQLVGDDNSRTTWILVLDQRAFVPCSLGFPPGKTWYRRAERDGRAVLRIAGRRYPVSLKRIQNPALKERLAAVVRSKYSMTPPGESEVWFFAVQSRTQPAPTP